VYTKIVPPLKIVVVAGAMCAALFMFSPRASANQITLTPAPAGPLGMSYTTDSQYLIGTVVPGLQGNNGQAARDAAMTNFLLGMSTQHQTTANGSLYSRATWLGGSPATTAGAKLGTNLGIGTTNVTINLSQFGGTFEYLVAAYDGPNGGAAVWNIAGLTGTITIYGYAKPEKVNGQFTGNLLGSAVAQRGYFRITSFTLLNPTAVPDGGRTVILLGAAFGVLGMVRRRIRR